MIHRLRTWEEKCVVFAGFICPPALSHIRRYQRLLRYLVAGSTVAAVDFSLLFLFTDIFGVHYLVSAMLAFVIAFFASFFLQKFWTFQNDSTDGVRTQMALYFTMAIVNLGINTALMYLFVDIFEVWYMAAQFLASGLIACESFFVGRHVIFKNTAK